jgi:flagellar basal body-associated protein FliL
MFEKEIKFISDFTTNKINYLGSFFTYDELFNSDINPAILKFISAEVDYRIYEDRKKILHQSSFNYSGSEIARYFNLIGKEIKKSTKITYHDIRDVANQAVAFNIDYTISPNETLLSLLFDKRQEISAENLKLKLNYIYYYPHIKDILISYVEKKKLSKVSLQGIKNVLKDIDEQINADNQEKAVENAIKTISDFYNIGSSGNNNISANLVEIYLEKNHLEKYLSKLKGSIPRDLKQKYNIGEIVGILFSTAPVKIVEKTIVEETGADEETVSPDIEQMEEEVEKVKNVEAANEEDSAGSELHTESLEESDEKEIEFDITEHENLDALYNFSEEEDQEEIPPKEESKIGEEKVSDELNTSEDYNEKENKDEPLIIKEEEKEQEEVFKSDTNFFHETENQPSSEELNKRTRSKDIFSYLSDKEIERIVGNVFNDDRDDFAGTMEKISESDNYDEATEILKSVFKSYNINPYSKDAITFTNSVSNYFEQT